MKISKAIAVSSSLLLAQLAVGGTWDVGEPFNNNDAVIWTLELELSADLSIVTAAFVAVEESTSNIEAPTASIGIAAAEVVAALLGRPRPDLPENVVGWVKEQSQKPDNELIALAERVVTQVEDAEKSELAQQWAESDEPIGIWKSNLSDLKQRLQESSP